MLSLLLIIVILAVVVAPTSSFPMNHPKRSNPTPTSYPSNWNIDPVTHPYVAPGPGDRRGPCPMLNVLANHGYLPHNGLATPEQIIAAACNISSVGLDSATVLVLLEHAFFGDILNNQLSIGRGGLNNHGGIENDASLTRDDWYFNHDAWTFNSTKWRRMRNFMNARPDAWSVPAMIDYRAIRFNESLATNPQFWFSVTSLTIQAGAGLFVSRLFGLPDQTPTTSTVSSIFTQEKLFPGFGKQSVPVTVPEIFAVALDWLVKYPMPLSPLNIITNPPKSPECLLCAFRNALVVQLPVLRLPTQQVLNRLLDGPYLQCTATNCS